MRPTSKKRQYSIGELVMAAYATAEKVSDDPRIVSVVASSTLSGWLTGANQPGLIRPQRTTARK
ncbi:MAG TPA: hypothetical protein VGP07_26135 [Polyangia bacterium]|jgi:hypothetical protein